MTVSGMLVLFLMTGLGFVGFVDDYMKLFMRRSLGLRSGAKLLGQVIVAVIFAVLAIHFPDSYDLTPASEHLSFNTDFGVSLGAVLFVVWALVMVTATSNGVNLTDGLDGLATGASILVLAAYVLIGNWQWRNDCTTDRRELLPGARPARRGRGGRGGDAPAPAVLWWNDSPRPRSSWRRRLTAPAGPGGPGIVSAPTCCC